MYIYIYKSKVACAKDYMMVDSANHQKHALFEIKLRESV